ncbi:MAG TPA: CheR family methyltransferase, partial [Humisphaera sp.]|nr:CheR family methyltransferase [Humisphaera sp.]
YTHPTWSHAVVSFPALHPGSFRHIVFPELARRVTPIDFSALDQISTQLNGSDAIGSAEDLEILGWILRQGGLNSEDYKPETLVRRAPACLRTLRVGSMREAKVLLERKRQLITTAINALLIGVTGFFRDEPVFSALSRTTLPELTRRCPAPRIWSIGCSDGAELYSVAMILADIGKLHRCELLGTDCRADAIAQAAEGIFEEGALKGLSPHLLARYFRNSGGTWRVDGGLRAMVRWRVSNILRICEPMGWDMILCRNLAIYLRPTIADYLWHVLVAALLPGGYLVLGKAERPPRSVALREVAPCIFKRYGS